MNYTSSHILTISIATESGYPDYPDHLDHFLSGSKWVLPGHTHMPDPDQNYLAIMCIESKTAINRGLQ